MPADRAYLLACSQEVEIERIIKGMKRGNAWDELQQLSLRMAGLKLF